MSSGDSESSSSQAARQPQLILKNDNGQELIEFVACAPLQSITNTIWIVKEIPQGNRYDIDRKVDRITAIFDDGGNNSDTVVDESTKCLTTDLELNYHIASYDNNYHGGNGKISFFDKVEDDGDRENINGDNSTSKSSSADGTIFFSRGDCHKEREPTAPIEEEQLINALKHIVSMKVHPCTNKLELFDSNGERQATLIREEDLIVSSAGRLPTPYYNSTSSTVSLLLLVVAVTYYML